MKRKNFARPADPSLCALILLAGCSSPTTNNSQAPSTAQASAGTSQARSHRSNNGQRQHSTSGRRLSYSTFTRPQRKSAPSTGPNLMDRLDRHRPGITTNPAQPRAA